MVVKSGSRAVPALMLTALACLVLAGPVRAAVEMMGEVRVKAAGPADDAAGAALFKNTLAKIKARLEAAGLKGYRLEPTEGHRFKVILAEEQDAPRAPGLVTRMGRLRFQLVRDPSPTRHAMRELPPGSELVFNMHRDPGTGRVARQAMILDKAVAIDGSRVVKAQAVADPGGGWHVQLRLDKAGAAQLAEITSRNIGRAMAIVLDGRVLSAPMIRAKIDSPRARIDGNFNQRAAHELAAMLNIGPLPSPVMLLGVRRVDK